jgi:ergothioneine biosynthesis protein EgtB
MKANMEIRPQLIQSYQRIRKQTEQLCAPLFVEDYVVQSHDDISPPKWHLAHTTWFFETFILAKQSSYKVFNPLFHHLFNSYYQSIGHPYPRMQRGILSRPTVEMIYQYRKQVDEQMMDYLQRLPEEKLSSLMAILTVGFNHEQQHQELLLMDIKYNFSLDPSSPAYQKNAISQKKSVSPLIFHAMEGGVVEIGHSHQEFCFDNELPRHPVFLQPYALATRLITNGEYLAFMQAGGYQNPSYWLSDAWDCVLKQQWDAPLYWQQIEGQWHIFTLNGLQVLNLAEPVSHISYYEAEAYARWKNKRLPSEAEWEHFVARNQLASQGGNFLENNIFHPMVVTTDNPHQLFGDVWEWTASAYLPYPGYKPLDGALGEYNGKFMNNQFVLRGGSCATPEAHIRASYRNFFQPDKRWQFSGIRLAE